MSADGPRGAVRAVLRAALGAELRSPRPWLAAAAFGLIAGYALAALAIVPRVAELGPAVDAILPVIALTVAAWAGGGTGAALRDGSAEVLLASGVQSRQLVLANAIEAMTIWTVPAVAGLACWAAALAVAGVGVTSATVALAAAVLAAVVWGAACGVAAGALTAHPWVGSIAGASLTLGTWLLGAGGDVARALEGLEGIGPRRLVEGMVLGLVQVRGLVSLGVQVLIVLTVAWAAIEVRRGRPRVGQLGSRRVARFGAATMVAAIAFVTALVAADERRVDLTATSSFTVGADTEQLLDASDEPIELIGLYRPGQPGRDEAERLLSAYAQASGTVEARMISPDDAGPLAADLALTDGGAVVVASGEIRIAVSAPDEERLAAAVRRIVGGDREQLCFTTRSGERDLEDASSPGGLGRLDRLLAGEGYSVVPVLSANRSLDDCDAVIVVAPTRPLTEAAVGAIHRYLAAGGRVVVFGDAGEPGLLQPLLSPLGARTAGPFVADAGQRLSEDLTVVVARSTSSDASAEQVVLHGATPVALSAGAVTLLVTSEATWLERGGGDLLPEFTAGVDARGPLTMAGAVAHQSGKGFRLVVVGDADVVSNAWLRAAGNTAWLRDMLPLALRGERAAAGADSSESDSPVLDVSESGRWTFALGAIAIPTVLSVALATFFRRRRRPRIAMAAVVAAGILAMIGVVLSANAAAATDAKLVVWGEMVVPVPTGVRVAENSPVRLTLTKGTDPIEAAVAVQTLPLDVEHLATLNGGEVTGRGADRIGGAVSRWVSSTNLSGYQFRDHVVDDEGIAILTRWKPGSESAVRAIMRGLSFQGRFALRTPISDVLQLLSRGERQLPGLRDEPRPVPSSGTGGSVNDARCVRLPGVLRQGG